MKQTVQYVLFVIAFLSLYAVVLWLDRLNEKNCLASGGRMIVSVHGVGRPVCMPPNLKGDL
jgi:hypothetical protein